MIGYILMVICLIILLAANIIEYIRLEQLRDEVRELYEKLNKWS